MYREIKVELNYSIQDDSEHFGPCLHFKKPLQVVTEEQAEYFRPKSDRVDTIFSLKVSNKRKVHLLNLHKNGIALIIANY